MCGIFYTLLWPFLHNETIADNKWLNKQALPLMNISFGKKCTRLTKHQLNFAWNKWQSPWKTYNHNFRVVTIFFYSCLGNIVQNLQAIYVELQFTWHSKEASIQMRLIAFFKQKKNQIWMQTKAKKKILAQRIPEKSSIRSWSVTNLISE